MMGDDVRQPAGNKELTSVTEQLLHAYEELDLLHSVCEILSSSSEPEEANKQILYEAMTTLAADLGWVVYDDGGQGDRQVLRQNIDTRTAAFLNDAVVHEAIKAGEHVWTDNLAKELAAPNLKVPRAFLCVPLKTRTDTLGAICLGKFAEGAVFTAGDLKLVQILCTPAANAILQRRIERASELKRYVSPQLAESVMSGGDIQLRNKRAELTMFQAELKGFTEAAEEIEPEELVEILNEYLSAMTDIVFANEGTLDKFVLGSIFGFFGDPIAQADHALRAVRMAEQMQHAFAPLLARWRAEGFKPFGLGIGINTGYVTVGHIGSSNRTDYTAIGKNVLVAARLASIAEHGQILIGQRTVTKVKDAFNAQFVASRDIGTQPIKIYQVEYDRGPAPVPLADETLPVRALASSADMTVPARALAPSEDVTLPVRALSPSADETLSLRPPALSTDGKLPVRALARAVQDDHATGEISHYRIVNKVGEGAMGEVYKAQDLRLDRTVALKLLPRSKQDDEVRRRFVREAKALSALNHPNIATIYEIDDADGVSFIAMEYIGGRTLKDILDAGPLTVSQALDLAIPVAEALSNAHERNIIHRDIKPTNIMMSDDGYVKVLDFGLAKSVIDDDPSITGMLTQAGTVWGTIAYMSPEQAMGVALDQRSDIFSFGCVLYEAIAGRQPFGGNNPMAIMHAVTFDHPVPLSRLRPEAGGELERIVNKTLQKKAADRYQSLKDTLVDLKRLRKDLERR